MSNLWHSVRAGFKFAHKGNTSIGGATTDTVSFFGRTGSTAPTAMTARTATTLNTGDAGSDTALNNVRTRVNELEDKLKALGLLT